MIIDECGCFDVKEVYAYAENGRFCGSLDNATKLFDFEIRSCTATAENAYTSCLMDGSDMEICAEPLLQALIDCIRPYETMLEDLICMGNEYDKWLASREELCDCPAPCYEMQYHFTTGRTLTVNGGDFGHFCKFSLNHKIL